MITILSALASLLSFRVRSRASLELELVALRYQVTVLRRQRPGQLRLFSTDRLLRSGFTGQVFAAGDMVDACLEKTWAGLERYPVLQAGDRKIILQLAVEKILRNH
jgi:hypothetical protein